MHVYFGLMWRVLNGFKMSKYFGFLVVVFLHQYCHTFLFILLLYIMPNHWIQSFLRTPQVLLVIKQCTKLKIHSNKKEKQSWSYLETVQTSHHSNSLPLHWQPWPWCQCRPNTSTPFPWLLQQASMRCPALCPNMSSALWRPKAHQSDAQISGAMAVSILLDPDASPLRVRGGGRAVLRRVQMENINIKSLPVEKKTTC